MSFLKENPPSKVFEHSHQKNEIINRQIFERRLRLAGSFAGIESHLNMPVWLSELPSGVVVWVEANRAPSLPSPAVNQGFSSGRQTQVEPGE